MGSGSYRYKRVGVLIQQELSEILEREIKDPHLLDTIITVVEVRVDPNLRNAKVYLSVLDEDKRESVLEAINKASGFIRHQIASKLSLRYMPELFYTIDTTLADAMELEVKIRAALGKDEGFNNSEF